MRPNIDTMQIVAENTGGRAFFNTNDITRAIRRAIDDSRVTYILGYYPSDRAWDGRFRRISVKVNRSGMQVRHRRGYLALPAPLQHETNRDEALRDVLHSALEATGIGVSARLARTDSQGDGSLDVTVRVDTQSVTLEADGGRWRGAVDVIIAQSLPNGTFVASAFVTLNLDFTAEQRDRAMREGLVLTRRVALHDKAHQLRVAARDVPSGAAGSLIIARGKLKT